jgi:hypothetical protein
MVIACDVQKFRRLVISCARYFNVLAYFGGQLAGQMSEENAAATLYKSKQLLRRSHYFTEGGWRKYWFDCILLLILVLILAGLRRDARLTPPESGIIAKRGGLEPFHVIELADLRLTCQSEALPLVERATQIIGHYSFNYLGGCAAIDPKRLSSGARLTNELDTLVLVRIKVQPTTLFSGMQPPFRAALMCSPRERDTTALLFNDLMVLDLEKNGDQLSIVVAIPSDEEPTLASFIARSDLLLVSGHR